MFRTLPVVIGADSRYPIMDLSDNNPSHIATAH